MAKQFYQQDIKRPIVNGELCYEGSSYWARYERISRFDVRKAIWTSLLSGAKAGIGYGAHGVWAWHKNGAKFFSFYKEAGWPFEWRVAMKFLGAWDASFAKDIFLKYNLFKLEPDFKLSENIPEIRYAVSEDMIAIYVPYPVNVFIPLKFKDFYFVGFNLEKKDLIKPEIIKLEGKYFIKMLPFNSDALFIGSIKNIY